MEPTLTYGCEIAVDKKHTSHHWFSSKQERDSVVDEIAKDLRRAADNVEVRVLLLVRLPDESVYRAHGPAALHVKWRECVVRMSHRAQFCYQQQRAVVDVISGRVVIDDVKEPFEVSQYDEWPMGLVIEERFSDSRPGASASFWPSLRPASANERCHYVIATEKDVSVLRSGTTLPSKDVGWLSQRSPLAA